MLVLLEVLVLLELLSPYLTYLPIDIQHRVLNGIEQEQLASVTRVRRPDPASFIGSFSSYKSCKT